MQSIDIKITKNFRHIRDNPLKITILEGSSRSGKTIATCQYIIAYCLSATEPKMVTVARANLVIAKRTVMIDFQNELRRAKIKFTELKSTASYIINGCTVRFVGLDKVDKVYGLSQHLLYVNEGLDDIKEEFYLQLLQRTIEKVVVDYNPHELDHFLYDWEKRNDTNLFRTNVFDNPMVPEESLKQILSYEPNPANVIQGTANEFYWKVYGLGERHRRSDVVFTQKPKAYTSLKDVKREWTYYGGDFGFTDPMTLVEVIKEEDLDRLYVRVLLHEVSHTNSEIAAKIKDLIERGLVDEDIPQVWDSASPESIKELRLLGITAIGANKKGGIYFGLQKLKNYDVFIYEDELSQNLRKEMAELRYETDNSGKVLKNTKNQPLIRKGGDHCIDPIRYVLAKFT